MNSDIFLKKKAILSLMSLVSKIDFFNEYFDLNLDKEYPSAQQFMKTMEDKKLKLNFVSSTNGNFLFELKLVDTKDYVKLSNIMEYISTKDCKTITFINKKKEFIINFNDDSLKKINDGQKIKIQSNNINHINNWLLYSAVYNNYETKKFLEESSLFFIRYNIEVIKNLYLNQEIRENSAEKVIEFTELLFNDKKQNLLNTKIALNEIDSWEYYLKHYLTLLVCMNEDEKWNTKENNFLIGFLQKIIQENKYSQGLILAQKNLFGYKNDYINIDEIDFKIYKNFYYNLFQDKNFSKYLIQAKYNNDFDIFNNKMTTLTISYVNLKRISDYEENSYSLFKKMESLFQALEKLGYIKNSIIDINDNKEFFIISFDLVNIKEEKLKEIINKTMKKVMSEKNADIYNELRATALTKELNSKETISSNIINKSKKKI
jgi:hypothetical protein